ncbi:LytTR family transcriptional regulator [Roseiarcus fermentans]|uniref:LytTR family transcriptional regulator n=1 Tax=Roseiarcus fermentans TaxID=1473586 RepID=A0A366FNL0_9HYPH|nr:LytTR family DNA-binding domain-containing protein [Roseiarcus fermentans]RBP16157.1 LytTR family transcriptional regulator [Roseiarcus fermentans]
MPLRLRDWIGRIRDRSRRPVHEAPTAAGPILPDYRLASGIAIGVAALFVVLSPVGTDRLSTPVRLGYWLGIMLGGSAIGVALARWLYRAPAIERHPVLGALVAGVILTPPISILVAAANRFAFGLSLVSAAHWLTLLPAVFGLSCGLSLVNIWASRGRRASMDGAPARQPAREDASPPPPPACAPGADEGEAMFRSRLPYIVRTADLWALEAEDHYLRVHSSAGRTLILMRLSDAMAALARLDGAQTHRSWWVARSAATPIETNQGRAVLALPDGTRAPVSRSFYRDLKARGWL